MRTILVVLLFAFANLAVAETSVFSRSSNLIQAARFTPPRPYHIGALDASLYAGVVAYRALDYLSTEPCVHSLYCEEKELPQFVVNTKPGFIAFEASAAATEIASSYLLHRRGHGKAARAFDAFSIGSGSWGVEHNYALRTH
jgi:hypothetical protein